MLKRRNKLDELGATAVFVAFDEPEQLRASMLGELDEEMAYPLIVDRTRACYAAWGLHRTALSHVLLDPNVWKQYARLIAGGQRLRRAGGDLRQLGGDFVVGPDGRIIYARPQERDDRPPVGELLAAIGSG